MEEEQLLERARGGDPNAFGDLVAIYHDRVYALTYKYVLNAQDARDLAQLVWIKAWKKLDTFKGRSRFYTWLYRVAVFVCLDYLRKRKREGEVPYLDELESRPLPGTETPPSVQSRPDRQAQRDEIMERFRKALDTLSPEHRMTLILREVEGRSYEEIAEAMKCRKGTVMSRIFYARKALQREMGDLK